MGGPQPREGAASSLLWYLVPVAVLLVLRMLVPFSVCDDACISLRMAQNLADGNGMAFNAHDPVYVSTSPLWVLLIAAGRLVLGDVILAVKVLSLLAEVAMLVALVHLCSALPNGRRIGALAGVLLVTNPAYLLTCASGMELPLYLLVIVLAADLVSRRRYAWALALGAAAVWVRLDGIVLFACVLAASAWEQLRGRELGSVRRWLGYLPGLAVLAGYFLFGILVFNSALPASAQRKLISSPALFSPAWLSGAWVNLREVGWAVLGMGSFWYRTWTPLIICLVPFAFGVVDAVRGRRRQVAVLAAFSLLYALSLAGAGNPITVNFPWYFVPVLPGFCAIAAIGLDALFERLKGTSTKLVPGVEIVFIVVWAAVMYLWPIDSDLPQVTTSMVGVEERERAYAAVAVWVGEGLPPGTLVAANEIGAVGLYLPPEDTVLDMFGLLRHAGEMKVGYPELFRRRMPEVVITRPWFSYAKTIEEAFPAKYRWYPFRGVLVGLRSDVVPSAGMLRNIQRDYDSLDMSRERRWKERGAIRDLPSGFSGSCRARWAG